MGLHDIITDNSSIYWETPDWFFKEVHRSYQFTTDVCAVKENAKCSHFYTEEQDGLKQAWAGTCWLNPPYGRKNKIEKWLQKAIDSQNSATTVALIPYRSGAGWFDDLVHGQCTELWAIRGRLDFKHLDGRNDSATFDSAIVVYGDHPSNKTTPEEPFATFKLGRVKCRAINCMGFHDKQQNKIDAFCTNEIEIEGGIS